MLMKPKMILMLFILALLTDACSTNNASNKLPNEVFSDTTSYPKQAYSRVTLFVLDSNEEDGGGYYRFIDTSGRFKRKNFASYMLDSVQIKRLQSYLVPQPCADSIRMDKLCAPTFKNVFIFFDRHNKQVAQVHLCFHCELSMLFPYPDYMCDFDNKVNWASFKSFADSIKKSNPHAKP